MEHVGDVFNRILNHIGDDGAKLVPVQEHRDEFLKFIRTHDMLGRGQFSAYPDAAPSTSSRPWRKRHVDSRPALPQSAGSRRGPGARHPRHQAAPLRYHFFEVEEAAGARAFLGSFVSGGPLTITDARTRSDEDRAAAGYRL